MSVFSIIKKPVITEKSQRLELKGVYTLFVSDRATKVDVRSAIERLYGVKVEKVNMIKTRAKVRVNGKRGSQVKRKERTKALVTLKDGARIADFQKIVTQ
jgi:large subunit ribosomal protein L23